jgi:cyclohexanecarboxylate-CoA ligase
LAAQSAHGSEPLFPRLRICVNGGAPPPPGMCERIVRELNGAVMVNGYGLTECAMIAYTPVLADAKFVASGSVVPAASVEVRVVGPGEEELDAGLEGEIRLRGPQLTAGYVDPAQEDGLLDAKGFLRTGDLGIIDTDGSFRITGRLKDIIIRNAENISAPEVESVLSAHSAVADVSVVGVPDPRTGERCCAVVVLVPGVSSLELVDVVAFCKSRGLAAYKIPERLDVIEVIPRNPMGKVVKAELRHLVLATPS